MVEDCEGDLAGDSVAFADPRAGELVRRTDNDGGAVLVVVLFFFCGAFRRAACSFLDVLAALFEVWRRVALRLVGARKVESSSSSCEGESVSEGMSNSAPFLLRLVRSCFCCLLGMS